MGSILHLPTGARRRLPALARLGRAPGCELVDDHPWVSATHATITWSSRGWSLRDERSRNGTWLNRQPLGDASVVLEAGQLIGLGQQEPLWQVLDVEPPQPFARRAADTAGGPVEIDADEDGAISLPSARGPVELRWSLEHGGWVVDEGERDRPVHDRERLSLDADWVLHLPSFAEPTLRLERVVSLDEVSLGFRVSRDLEHVGVALAGADRRSPRWLSPKVAFWPLYLLASERLRDRGAPEHEGGWMDVEQLLTDSGLDRKKLDIYLGRARRSLEEVGLVGADQVVEVRRGQRRLSLLPDRLWVEGP